VSSGLPASPSIIVFDFDGVFTDNRVYVDQEGKETVRCSRSDGMGISLLRQAGIRHMILSTETNPVVLARAAKLQMEAHTSCGDKKAFLAQFLQDHGLEAASAVFVGNDINDLGAMEVVGFPVCPADSHPRVLDYVRSVAGQVLTRVGGDGAVRELCDLILAE
jgi:3-deoxy-D-manno-octulosonate 8-phosphate phosphatase (KDO 8-P phosphatase)